VNSAHRISIQPHVIIPEIKTTNITDFLCNKVSLFNNILFFTSHLEGYSFLWVYFKQMVNLNLQKK
jgi:hypothetical protein